MTDSVMTSLEVDNHEVGGGAPMPGQRVVSYKYTPDKLNRHSVTDSATGQTTGCVANPLNQYMSVGGIGYSYDNKFNLTGAEGFTGTYDAANRLVSASNSAMAASAEVELVYDGLGRCVKRTIQGVATIIIYDDWKPIAEWDGWIEEYFQAWNVYGPGADELLLRQGGKWGYVRYHPDANGNVAFLLDNDGAVVEKYTYDVFGRPKITDRHGNPRAASHYDNRFLFQGREYIGEVGVYDYRNRFYHPALGRFLQKDPTGFDAGDMNLFRYCGDDPIDGSDPTGLTNAQSQITPDRIWEMAKYMDSGNTLQGTFQEQMNQRGRDNAGVAAKSVSSENEGTRHAGGVGATRASDGSIPGYTGGEGNVAAPGTDPSQGVVAAPTGKLSLAEANQHYRTGNGVSVAVQASKYRFRGVALGSFNPATNRRLYTFPRGSPDWRVFGTVTLQANRGGNSFRVLTDIYNFEMHPWTQEPIRNLATMYGQALAGEGTPYRIIFLGNVGLPTR